MEEFGIIALLQFHLRDLETIIGTVVELAAILIGLISISLVVRKALSGKKRGNEFQKALINSFNRSEESLLIGHRIFPVRYASEKYFLDKTKQIVWEGCGVLTLSPSTLVFNGRRDEDGRSLQFKFTPDAAKISWVGRKLSCGGFFSWLVVRQQEEKYYFTFEPARVVIGSKKNTKKMYDELKKNFP